MAKKRNKKVQAKPETPVNLVKQELEEGSKLDHSSEDHLELAHQLNDEDQLNDSGESVITKKTDSTGEAALSNSATQIHLEDEDTEKSKNSSFESDDDPTTIESVTDKASLGSSTAGISSSAAEDKTTALDVIETNSNEKSTIEANVIVSGTLESTEEPTESLEIKTETTDDIAETSLDDSESSEISRSAPSITQSDSKDVENLDSTEISKSDSADSTGESSETTSTPEPAPSVPRPKKRLTLQERLALVAKGKARKAKPSLLAVASLDSEDVTESENPDIETPNLSNQLTPVLSRVASNDNTESELYLKISTLEKANKQLQEQVTSLSSKTPLLQADKQWQQKLEKAEGTIQELLQEGEILSKRELKLNDSIKKLKLTNNNLELNLQDYRAKSDESSIQLTELEAFVKSHNFSNVEGLLESYSDMSYQLASLQSSLEKEQEWQPKYLESVKLYESELTAKKQAHRDLNDCEIQLSMIKRQHSLEIQLKNTLVNDLKRELSVVRTENVNEISRLESKIELLRVGQENSHEGQNESKELDTNLRTVDYSDFAKLSETHHNLHQQYLSAQENWKMIESSLLGKLDISNLSVESLKKVKSKLTQDLKKLTLSLQQETDSKTLLGEKHSELQKQYSELQFTLKVRENELSEALDKFEKFNSIYNAERSNLNTKIDTLTKLANERPRLGSQSSIVSQSVPSWPDIKFGESLMTPSIPEFPRDESRLSLGSLAYVEANESQDNISFESNMGSFLGTINGYTGSNGNGYTGGASGLNIQLLNKMSSNIRRLEIELHTLREENSQLAVSQELIEQELLAKVHLNDELADVRAQIDELTAERAKQEHTEQTMLELIGEKLEQVEELRADIVDLKGLLRLQVQQMMEIQEKSK